MTALSDELEAMLKAATPGELTIRDHVVSEPHNLDRVKISSQHGPLGSFDRHDAALIVALVNNAPRLIEALRASEWQPIETAPRDQTWVICWGPDYGFGLARFYPNIEWAEEPEYTHWRPLPAPPATEAGE